MKMEFAASFAGLVDLAAEALGGQTLGASDAFFAEESNLLKPGRGVFIPDKYTDRGKWMDGWESRRRRGPGFDWCVIKLGVPGRLRGLDIDTNHFLGNHPPFASVEACFADGDPDADSLTGWQEILSKSALNPGSQNLFAVTAEEVWSHLRLNIYPDGGVARFRAYGEVQKPWRSGEAGEVDLAALVHGGRVLTCNDMFFGDKNNLILPRRAKHMGEGWETRRKRVPGYDWCILKLADTGRLTRIVVDTNHFKGNYPDRCSLEGCLAPHTPDDQITGPGISWQELLPQTKLSAHREHVFTSEIQSHDRISHVRLNIYPDGGVSRLRLFGRVK